MTENDFISKNICHIRDCSKGENPTTTRIHCTLKAPFRPVLYGDKSIFLLLMLPNCIKP